jgi:histone arginine demethylase JMJD6
MSTSRHPQSSQATAPAVEKRSGVSYREFYRDYERTNRPVVLTDALADWPALGKWTPEFFAERYGEKEFEIDEQQWKLKDFVATVLRSDSADPAPYLRNQVLQEHFPELLQDIRPDARLFQPNWMERSYRNAVFRDLFHRGSAIEFYLGGQGRGFPVLHWDGYHTHAFLMQFYGRKEFYVYDPGQSELLYPRPDVPNLSQCADIHHVDLEKFPRFAEARPAVFVLEPGETLFIPSGWWHTTRMLSPSISLSCNVGNATNWRAMRKDLVAKSSPLNRLKATAYLTLKSALFTAQDLLAGLPWM